MKKTYLVVGLGRFGSAVAQRLYELGSEVMAVDLHPELVQKMENKVTCAAVCDARDEDALRALGARTAMTLTPYFARISSSRMLLPHHSGGVCSSAMPQSGESSIKSRMLDEVNRNPLLAHTKKMLTPRAYREKSGEFAADGVKLLAEAVRWNFKVSRAPV